MTWYDFRCRIPECDGNETNYQPEYQPEWLRNAVPYTENKPSQCERYPPVAVLASTNGSVGSVTDNETTCVPDIFDNSTRDKCRDWVFETEEWTIANEVTYFCFNSNQPVVYLIFNKMSCSVFTQLQYISSLTTCFGFLQNHLQAVVNYREVHPVCAHIMGSRSV